MVFVLSIVTNFAPMVDQLLPTSDAAQQGQQTLRMGMASFTPQDLQFLATITVIMIILMALVSSFAVLITDGGYRLKVFFYIALTIFISGISLIIVSPMVAGILTV